MNGESVKDIADCILSVLNNIGNEDIEKDVQKKVLSLCSEHPIPGIDEPEHKT